MENASKALIIAGAILLAISIIGIGMYVFQQARGAMDGIGMQSEKAAAYNQPFEPYLGTNIKGQDVRNLLDTVRQHNTANFADETLKITVTLDGSELSSASELSNAKQDVTLGTTYTVNVPDDGYDESNGYITSIEITANS